MSLNNVRALGDDRPWKDEVEREVNKIWDTLRYSNSLTSSSLSRTSAAVIPSTNFLINGGFDFWQRGTSFSASGYTADRWYFTETGICTVSQETTLLPPGFNYALKALAATSNDSVDLYQPMENIVVTPLRSKTVTFSCYLKMDTNMQAQSGAFELVAYYSTSSDARASQTTLIGTVAVDKSLYTDWARATYTFVVPTDAVGLMVGIEPPLCDSSQPQYWVTGTMLEIGSSATEFRRAGSTWTQEQQACQRYYYRLTNPSAATNAIASGAYYSTTACYVPFRMPVSMRIAPTLATSTASNFLILAGGASRAASAIAQYGTVATDVVTMNVTTSAGTAGQGAWLETATNGAWLEFSAEL
jgi:hypothetical protein